MCRCCQWEVGDLLGIDNYLMFGNGAILIHFALDDWFCDNM